MPGEGQGQPGQARAWSCFLLLQQRRHSRRREEEERRGGEEKKKKRKNQIQTLGRVQVRLGRASEMMWESMEDFNFLLHLQTENLLLDQISAAPTMEIISGTELKHRSPWGLIHSPVIPASKSREADAFVHLVIPVPSPPHPPPPDLSVIMSQSADLSEEESPSCRHHRICITALRNQHNQKEFITNQADHFHPLVCERPFPSIASGTIPA
ncbi:unnamed protein product [Pleuronectes platessa]|uniref:Uncharacterized protein n=1 Tax=Pleuronectes platessa TaxID=8262 RepID=A0A9N7TRT5_PLEPL|nr:unnamed protein product [Pleuronectes platessa]